MENKKKVFTDEELESVVGGNKDEMEDLWDLVGAIADLQKVFEKENREFWMCNPEDMLRCLEVIGIRAEFNNDGTSNAYYATDGSPLTHREVLRMMSNYVPD